MKFSKSPLLTFVFVSLSLVTAIPESEAVQITAEASGSSLLVPIADQTQTLQNGDFEIFRGNPLPIGSRGYLIGDGINEYTRWNLDFTQSPDFPVFDPFAPLTAADLLIRVVPKGDDFSSDFLRIDSLPNVSISGLIPSFTINVPLEININLLTFYSSNIILDIFRNGGGAIAMRYEDDAILTFAQLRLSNDIPEPQTYLLMVAALLAFSQFRNQKLKLL